MNVKMVRWFFTRNLYLMNSLTTMTVVVMVVGGFEMVFSFIGDIMSRLVSVNLWHRGSIYNFIEFQNFCDWGTDHLSFTCIDAMLVCSGFVNRKATSKNYLTL